MKGKGQRVFGTSELSKDGEMVHFLLDLFLILDVYTFLD